MPTKAVDGASGRRRAIGRPPGSTIGVGRERLLALACDLLKTTHHKQITRAHVARLAAVDASLIRYYFSTQEDLLAAAAERLTLQFRDYFRKALALADDSPESRICARIHAIVELTATYPFYGRFINEEVMHSDSPLARSIFGSLMDRGIGGLEEVITEGRGAGRFRDVDPKMLFSCVIGMGEFFLHTRRRAQVSSYPDEDGDLESMKARYKSFMCDLVFAGILEGNDGLGRGGVPRDER